MGLNKTNDLGRLKRILSSHKKDLKKRYHVASIGIFGSFARGSQKKKSDVDILVEFEAPIGFFKFLELEEHLSRLLNTKVDLVSKKALKPRIGACILKEVVHI